MPLFKDYHPIVILSAVRAVTELLTMRKNATAFPRLLPYRIAFPLQGNKM